MTVGQVMEGYTHRQFQGFVEYLRQGWNRPSRSDNYLMLLATRVQQVLAKDPKKVEMSGNRLKFDLDGKAELTPEQRARESKAAWLTWAENQGATISQEDKRLGEVRGDSENYLG